MSAQDWQRDPQATKAKAEPSKNTRKITAGSIFRLMYAPRLGSSFSEISRNSGIFTRLIASIFVLQGLFPRQHPALRDNNLRLPLSEVLHTAYRQLRWTKAGLPQIVFFFAVVATMVMTVIGFILALMNVFVGTAHAQGIFDAPFPTVDVANKWLDHIFTGASGFVFPNPETGTPYGVAGTLMPQMVRALAAQYSNAMLLVASIILIYHLFAMVAHTAHEGVTMGRSANQIWAPIRLVFALGLLVPVAGGWSSGQWLVAWIAARGSGLASNVWNNFGGNVLNQPVTMATTPDITGRGTISNLVRIGWCLKNRQFNVASDGQIIVNGPLTPSGNVTTADAMLAGFHYFEQPMTGVNGLRAGSPNKWYVAGVGASQWWTHNVCGSVMTQDYAPSATTTDPDYANLESQATAYSAAFDAIEEEAIQLGATFATAQLRSDGGTGLLTRTNPGPAYGPYNVGAALESLSNRFRNVYLGALNGGAGVGTSPLPCNYAYDGPTQYLSYTACPPNAVPDPRGWMVAGMYFMNIATKHTLAEKFSEATPIVSTEGDAAQAINESGEGPMYNDGMDIEHRGETQNNPASAQDPCGLAAESSSEKPIETVANCIFMHYGIMNDQKQMQTGRLFSGVNKLPFSDMVSFGQKLIGISTGFMTLGLALNVAPVATQLIQEANKKIGTTFSSDKDGMLSKAAQAAFKGNSKLIGWAKSLADIGQQFAPLLIGLGVLTFVPGFLLFYLLPALPFINFGLGIITWLMSLLQAVIAIPIIAIAHLTPQGEGLPSQRAFGAYLMILQIFLRPIMMVIGLFVAVLLINTGLTFASLVFIDSTNTSMIGTGIMDKLVYFALYTSVCYGIVHAATTAIDQFPIRATSWIGGGSVDQDHHHGNSIGGLIAGQTIMGKAEGMMGSLGRMPQGFGKPSRAELVQQQVESIGIYQEAAAKVGITGTGTGPGVPGAPGSIGANRGQIPGGQGTVQ